MRNILVVDDNESDLLIAKFLIEKKGYNPILTRSAFEALEQLDKQKTDFVVADWQMPQLSGMEFLKRVRGNPKTQKLPVMIMSGRNDVRDIRIAISNGASDYIIKPLDPQIFESKIARVIEAKMDWYEYAVPADHTNNSCKFVLDGRITAISEMGIEFESFANIPAQTDLILQLDLLKELNIPSVNVRVLKSVLKEKMYRVKASFVGLREGELQRIRVFCKTLMPKKAEDL